MSAGSKFSVPAGKWRVDGCMMELDSKTKVGGLLCLPGVYFAQKGSTRLLWGGKFRLCLSQQLAVQSLCTQESNVSLESFAL